MARRLQIEWHENERTLRALYKREKDHQNRTRLQALWLLRQGRTMKEVASLVGVHYRTVQEWVAWYRRGGLTEVLAHRHGGYRGQKRRLTPAQEAELKAKAEAGEIRTIWDAVEWAQQTYQVTYTYWGMRYVFERLKLRKKVPRPRSPKASAEAQEAWKKGGSQPNCRQQVALMPKVCFGVMKCESVSLVKSGECGPLRVSKSSRKSSASVNGRI